MMTDSLIKCLWHTCSNMSKDKFCGHKCKNKYYVNLNRQNTKKRAVEYKGGSCCKCGYNRSLAALEFHHTDPTKKDFALSHAGKTVSWSKIQEELEKCILVCANCHREIHYGTTED